MKLTLVAIVVAAAVLAGTSSASGATLINPDGSPAQPYQHWVDLSDVPTVSETYTLDTNLSACKVAEDIYACIFPTLGQIHLEDPRCGFTGPGAWRSCRFVVMHELGHPIERAWPDWKRQRFLTLVTDGRYPWSWSNPAQAPVLREAVADSYAMCSMHSNEPPSDDVMIPDFSRRTFLRVCHLMRIPDAKQVKPPTA